MREQVKKLSGKKTAPLKESITRYANGPFADWIFETLMPSKFTMPHCKLYDGQKDLEDHVICYKNRMGTCNIPLESMEAIMCKGFGAMLMGVAQRWYSALDSKSVRSFSELVTKFVHPLSDSKKR